MAITPKIVCVVTSSTDIFMLVGLVALGYVCRWGRMLDKALPRGLVMSKTGKYRTGSASCWLNVMVHD
jgi:hypothetical protein